MSDNLKQIKQKVIQDIDPNGAPESILAQNHQDILTQFLSTSGKYVGSSFIAKKQDSVFSLGTMSFNSNAFNATGNIVLSFSQRNADNVDFGKTLTRLNVGDLIVFKDFVGRTACFEYQSHTLNTGGSNAFYEVTVTPDSENINYTYQDTEEEICVISVILQSGGSAQVEKITVGGVEYLYKKKGTTGTVSQPEQYDLAENGIRVVNMGGQNFNVLTTLIYNTGTPGSESSWQIVSEKQLTF